MKKGMFMGWGHMNWGWGGAVMMIFWIALIGAATYWLIRSAQRQRPEAASPDSAVDILRKRYARGELSKDQFEQMKKDLS